MAPTDRDIARTLSGSRGPVRLRYRFFLSNSRAEEIREFTWIDDASIDMNNNRDATWKISFRAKANDAFNPSSDRLLAVADLRVSGSWHRFPLGLYNFHDTDTERLEGSRWWDLGGESSESTLLEDGPDGPYVVNKGTGVLAATKTILTEQAGIPSSMIDFPLGDETLKSDQLYGPSGMAGDDNWLRICSSLLGAGGYYMVYTLGSGRFTTKKTTDISSQQPDFSYVEGPEAMITGDIVERRDFNRFANKVIVTSEDPDQEPQIIAVAENNDPDSPGSIANYGGRVKRKKVTRKTLTSQAAADLIAKNELSRASAFYRTLSLESFADPRFVPHAVYELVDEAESSDPITGSWRHMNATLPLTDPPKNASHEFSRTERMI